MKIYIYYLLIILLLPVFPLTAGEKEIIDYARYSYMNSEYYNTITASMRYQYLYPSGSYYPESLILMGKAYFKADNYGFAAQMFSKCYNIYPNHPMGEEALFLFGHMRMVRGSPFYALRTFQEYRYVYKEGKYREKAALNISYTSVFTGNLHGSLENIKKFRKEFPQSKYKNEVDLLEKDIYNEINRPKKSLAVSVLGSVVLPGFGHFYTGNYGTGFFSLLTNTLLIFMVFDGYVTNNATQMIFFSIMEVSFYQYSLYSAVNNVREYNSGNKFYKRIKLSIGTEF